MIWTREKLNEAIANAQAKSNDPEQPEGERAFFSAQLERLREAEAELNEAESYVGKRAKLYKNGDYIDAMMKQMNYWRLNGQPLIKETDDVLGHWLKVKSDHPKG